MALTVGDLVGYLRADDSGWRRGLSQAALRLAGFQRDSEGRLRDMRGRFISEGENYGRILGDRLAAAARSAEGPLKRVGAAAAGIGVGVPVVAAVTTALGGLAAGAAAAGLAVKAFQLAAQPQLEAVANVADLAAKAEAAAAEGGKKAADAQAEYNRALSDLPPATRDTATAFVGLKKDFTGWSDALSGTTMPLFTQGIQLLRSLLPELTPFVKAAAGALSGLLDDVAEGVRGAEFREWADDMSTAAGPALSDFLTVIKNIAVGFGGLLQAFLPASAGVTGGLVDMTGAFADWGTGLKDSDGFADFLDLADEGGETLRTVAIAAGTLLVAVSPLIGITAQLALGLAQVINSTPAPVLSVLATVIAAVAVGMRLYAAYVVISTAVTRGWALAQAALNLVMSANPIGLVILAIAALVAGIIIAYKRSETFRQIVQAVWSTVKTSVTTAVRGILVAVGWLAALPGRIGRWFRNAKNTAIRQFIALHLWVAGLPLRLFLALAGLAGVLAGRARTAGASMVTAIRGKLTSAVNWVRGLPGRAKGALGSLGGVLWGAGWDLIGGFIDGITAQFGNVKSTLGGLTDKLTSWKGPESLDARLLTPAGELLIGGFQRGITNAVPGLRAQLRGLTGGLPGMAVPSSGATLSRPAAGPPLVRVVIDVTGSDDDLRRKIRRMVRVDGRGNVQTAFGR